MSNPIPPPSVKFDLKDLFGFASLLIAIISGSIWVGTVSQRVTNIEQQMSERKDQSERLARLETLVGEIRDNIVEVRREVSKTPH